MKKLVCKQVPPELQGDFTISTLKDMEGFAIFGNRDFYGMDKLNTYGLFEDCEFTNFENMLEDYETVENSEDYEFYEGEWKEVIGDYIKTELTENQLYSIRGIITENFEGYWTDERYIDRIVKIINVIDGRELEFCNIRGCSQGDWQYILYDPEMVDFNMVEAYYFNTGTEWGVSEVDSDQIESEGVENIDCDGAFYSAIWGIDKIKEDLSISFGYDLEDTLLFVFDGWNRSARYKQA